MDEECDPWKNRSPSIVCETLFSSRKNAGASSEVDPAVRALGPTLGPARTIRPAVIRERIRSLLPRLKTIPGPTCLVSGR